MNRHVFPQALPALLLGGLLAAAGWAQDGDGPRPPPQPADGTPTKGADPAGNADGAEGTDAEAPPEPPAVGEAFPAGLPIVALPRPGAVVAPSAVPAGGSADGRAEGAENAENDGGDGDGATAAAAPPQVTLATLVGDAPRPLILIFWSSRCVVCKRYGEVLGKLSAALGERVALVLIASGADETPEAVRAALEAANLHLPVYLDTEKTAAAALGVRVTPTAFLIDAEGVLRYRGPIDDDRRARSRDAREILRPAAESVLAGKALESGDVRPFGSALR